MLRVAEPLNMASSRYTVVRSCVSGSDSPDRVLDFALGSDGGHVSIAVALRIWRVEIATNLSDHSKGGSSPWAGCSVTSEYTKVASSSITTEIGGRLYGPLR